MNIDYICVDVLNNFGVLNQKLYQGLRSIYFTTPHTQPSKIQHRKQVAKFINHFSSLLAFICGKPSYLPLYFLFIYTFRQNLIMLLPYFFMLFLPQFVISQKLYFLLHNASISILLLQNS